MKKRDQASRHEGCHTVFLHLKYARRLADTTARRRTNNHIGGAHAQFTTGAGLSPGPQTVRAKCNPGDIAEASDRSGVFVDDYNVGGVAMSTVPNAVPNCGAWNADEICRFITSERLASYFTDTDGSVRQALHLYEWNMRASASVLELTSMVEVIVRNSLDASLIAWASTHHPGASWFDAAPLDAHAQSDIAKARRRATRHGRRPEVHGSVISELTLGFWRFLVESRYLTRLWVPASHTAFPHGAKDLRTRQEEVALRMKQLTTVRNRAAHHEPIHRRDLGRDLRAAIDLASWVSPVVGAWVASKNSLRTRIEGKPQP